MNHIIYQEKIQETLSRLPIFQQERIYRLVRFWVNHLTADKEGSLEDLLSLAGSWDDKRSAEQILKPFKRIVDRLIAAKRLFNVLTGY